MIRNPPLDTVRAACAHLLGPCCFLPSCPLLPSPAPSPSCCCWPPLAFSLVVPVTLRLSSPATQSLCGLFCFSCFLLLFVWCFLVSLLVFVGVFCCCACCQPTEVFTATQPCKIFFPSNARWLSPGRLSSRKDNCIVQIHRINAVATLSIITM